VNLKRLLFCFTMLAVFAMSARISMDTDSWWHLRAGQWIIENHEIPQVDIFSYTRYGQVWKYPGWLVEVPMYWIYQRLGPGGLNLWTAAMVTLAFFFIWQAASGDYFLRAFVIILSATAAGVYWSARPHLVTLLFSAIFLYLLEQFRWKKPGVDYKRLFWLPAIMMVWANCHGGFIVGFLIWGVYFLDGLVRWRRSELALKYFLALRLVGVAMVIAVCINPAGPVMLLYPFKTAQVGALQNYIQEWQPPDFTTLSVQPFVWLMILAFGAVGLSGMRLAFTDFLLVAGFGYLGLIAGRNIALFALVAALLITRHADIVLSRFVKKLDYLLHPEEPHYRLKLSLNWLIFCLLCLVTILKGASVFPETINQAAFEKFLPIKAVDTIHLQQLPHNLFNSYNWGGYLLFNLPDFPVFVDGRTDLYDDQIVDQWVQVVQAEAGWQDVLKQWQVKTILLEPHWPVTSLLAEEGWQLEYHDEIAMIFSRP
jgi:hypothetical protein